MSNLILDIGNTRCKAAIVEQGNVLEACAMEQPEKDCLSDLCHRHSAKRAIASVVGPMPDFDAILPTGLANGFHLLSCRSSFPMPIGYDTPETLGMDRLAAVVGARELCPNTPLMVVDAGTCITIDLLDDTDCYRGGAILPGIDMRFRAMHDYTASLPLVTLSDDERNGCTPPPFAGTSTRSSLTTGVCRAVLFEIQGFAEEYQRRYGALKLFLTGGNTDFFAKQLFFPNFANPNLIYIGLDKLLEIN